MHIYTDVADLGGLNAKCVVHGGRCAVPDGNKGPLLEFWGFSCKNFSRMFNCENREDLLTNILSEGKGSSGETFQSMLRSLREHPVFAVIIENVEDIMSEKHIENLIEGFDSIGMVVATDKFSSAEFGVPQRRIRVFGVALNVAMCNLPKPQVRALANRMVKWAGCSATRRIRCASLASMGFSASPRPSLLWASRLLGSLRIPEAWARRAAGGGRVRGDGRRGQGRAMGRGRLLSPAMMDNLRSVQCSRPRDSTLQWLVARGLEICSKLEALGLEICSKLEALSSARRSWPRCAVAWGNPRQRAWAPMTTCSPLRRSWRRRAR